MVQAASGRVPRAPPYSGSRSVSFRFRLKGMHLLRLSFQSHSAALHCPFLRSFNPGSSAGLGSSPFARHYSGNHFCFLFLRVLRCFSSPGCLPGGYLFHRPGDGAFPLRRVPPFGYPRFADCVRLLVAFRRFLRPSSALYAKTSAVRSSLFNLPRFFSFEENC